MKIRSMLLQNKVKDKLRSFLEGWREGWPSRVVGGWRERRAYERYKSRLQRRVREQLGNGGMKSLACEGQRMHPRLCDCLFS